MQNLSINDYWSKTALTPRRFRTLLTGLVRSHKDIKAYEAQVTSVTEKHSELGLRYRDESLLNLKQLLSSELVVNDSSEHSDGRTALRNEQSHTSKQRPNDDAQVMDHSILFSDLQQLVRPLLRDMESVSGLGVKFLMNSSTPNTFYAPRAQLALALFELVKNAIEAMRGPGKVKLDVQSENGRIEFIVSDEGVGMDDFTLAHCRRPFLQRRAMAILDSD